MGGQLGTSPVIADDHDAATAVDVASAVEAMDRRSHDMTLSLLLIISLLVFLGVGFVAGYGWGVQHPNEQRCVETRP